MVGDLEMIYVLVEIWNMGLPVLLTWGVQCCVVGIKLRHGRKGHFSLKEVVEPCNSEQLKNEFVFGWCSVSARHTSKLYNKAMVRL